MQWVQVGYWHCTDCIDQTESLIELEIQTLLCDCALLTKSSSWKHFFKFMKECLYWLDRQFFSGPHDISAHYSKAGKPIKQCFFHLTTHMKCTSYSLVICLLFCLFHFCGPHIIRLVRTMKDFLSCFYAPAQIDYTVKHTEPLMIILDNDRWASGLWCVKWLTSKYTVGTAFEAFHHFRSVAFKWLAWTMIIPMSCRGGVVVKRFRFITKETVGAVRLPVQLHHSDVNEEFVCLCAYICVSRKKYCIFYIAII